MILYKKKLSRLVNYFSCFPIILLSSLSILSVDEGRFISIMAYMRRGSDFLRSSFYFKFRLAVILFSLAGITSALLAEETLSTWNRVSKKVTHLSEMEHIYIDNVYIQSYRGKIGIWTYVASNFSLNYLAKKHGSEVRDLIELNDLSQNSTRVTGGQWFFLTYSPETLQNFYDEGIDRIHWEVPRGEFIWPVAGIRVTSRVGNRWGRLHPGIDIAAPTGTMVVAAMDGKVKESGYKGAYGKSIVLQHDREYITRYAHLSELFVKEGDVIKKGQVIGYSGNTGRSTGPHLHFEVRCMNVILNPEFFLPEFEESAHAAAAREDEKAEEE